MSAVDVPMVLRILDYRGVSVRLVKGQMMAGPSANLTDEATRIINRFRGAIMAYLAEQERLAETVSNTMRLSDSEFKQWQREIRLTPGSDPNLEHDRAALREVMRLKRLAEPVDVEGVAV